MKSRWLFLAVALSFAVVLCNLDHDSPTAGMNEHGHENFSGCVIDDCVALTSEDFLFPASAAGVFLLLAAALGFGLHHRLPGTETRRRSHFISANRIPRASNKLYQLHASYLL
ncbi:MAG: hypothetical protein HY349_01150 [Nitrospirae bacterium]|nr:hypothetical protein [Nitrospirota bacterium]